MKKEKRVEKWISLSALSLVASLQERSTLQKKEEQTGFSRKGKQSCDPLRVESTDVRMKL